MKPQAPVKAIKIAAEKAGPCQAFFRVVVLAQRARLLRAMHYKACILILVCILLPGYGDNYVTYAVGAVAAYTSGRTPINNMAAKKHVVNESVAPERCNKQSSTCTKSEGITDGSLWN